MRLPLSFLFMIPVSLAIKCLIDFDINIAMIIGLFVALSLIIGGTLTLKYLMMFLAPLRKGRKGRSGTENTARMAIGYGPVDVDYSPLWTEVLTLSEDSAGQRLLRRVQSLEDEDLLHPGRQMLGAALAQFVSRLTGTPVDHPIEGLLTAAAFFDGMSLHGLWKTARNYSRCYHLAREVPTHIKSVMLMAWRSSTCEECLRITGAARFFYLSISLLRRNRKTLYWFSYMQLIIIRDVVMTSELGRTSAILLQSLAPWPVYVEVERAVHHIFSDEATAVEPGHQVELEIFRFEEGSAFVCLKVGSTGIVPTQKNSVFVNW